MNLVMCLLTAWGNSWWGAWPDPGTICRANLDNNTQYRHAWPNYGIRLDSKRKESFKDLCWLGRVSRRLPTATTLCQNLHPLPTCRHTWLTGRPGPGWPPGPCCRWWRGSAQGWAQHPRGKTTSGSLPGGGCGSSWCFLASRLFLRKCIYMPPNWNWRVLLISII